LMFNWHYWDNSYGEKPIRATKQPEEKILEISHKWHMEFLYDPAIGLLSLYLEELTTETQTDTCMWMFMTALFLMAKRSK
jgi:hypothetical protein